MGSDDEDKYYIVGPQWADHWHIDGFPQSVDGLYFFPSFLLQEKHLLIRILTGFKSGEVKNFTMLIGILLADVPDEFMGNLTVYPGSHHLLEQFFRDQVLSL